jgi:hypothetical protein
VKININLPNPEKLHANKCMVIMSWIFRKKTDISIDIAFLEMNVVHNVFVIRSVSQWPY